MALYQKMIERAKEMAEEVKGGVEELAEEVNNIDNLLREITGKIDSHNCETAGEFDDFLSEIREQIVTAQGRLYK